MKKSHLLGALCICLAILSFNAKAVVLNTLNGVDYEWLELTETQGLSRDQVELRLADSNDVLYGYEYASRDLVRNLFLSYSPWDGLSGWHGSSDVTNGVETFIADFGTTHSGSIGGLEFNTVDGYTVYADTFIQNLGYYGLANECGNETTCLGIMQVYYDTAGNLAMGVQYDTYGWTLAVNAVPRANDLIEPTYGSYLIKSSAVPVPGAVWLFISGLLGLIGMARRKKA